MNKAKLMDLMVRAIEGDMDARTELIKEFSGVKMAYAPEGELDAEETLLIWEFASKTGEVPQLWMDTRLIEFSRVWEVRVRLDPYTGKPCTPGTIMALWESHGDVAVAAVAYGIVSGALSGNITTDKYIVKQYIESGDGVLSDLVTQVNSDRKLKAQYIDIVSPEVYNEQARYRLTSLKRRPNVSAGPGGVAVGGSVAGGVYVGGNVTVNGGDFVGRDKVVYDATELRRVIGAGLSDGELRSLCFDLGIDYDDLPSQGKRNKARELVSWCIRTGKVGDLVVRFKQINPVMGATL